MLGTSMEVAQVTSIFDLAADNDDVRSVLQDGNVGRLRASEILIGMGFSVTPWMVRSYRDRTVLDSTGHTRIRDQGKTKVVAFGDFQINKHDPAFLAKALEFVRDQKPDMICLTGDESDNSAVGRWAKGMREEFESNLQDQIDETVVWLTRLRDVAPQARIMMAHSNHMEWITRAVETRLPGFSSLRALTPESLYCLDTLGISYERKIVEFLPGYLLGHGHQWNLNSTNHATKGPEVALHTGKSILAGHTHQATIRTVFRGYEGEGEQLVYANPGCMMDFTKAMQSNGGYIKGTSPNWSKGIVIITRENNQNYTELVLGQNDGTFRYEGKIY